MEITLSEQNWQVKGYWPWVPVKEKSMETGQTLHGVTEWIDATVPGGVHYDLWKAGMIENPYFGMNSLKCEWVENRWWMYRTTFSDHLQGIDLKGKKVTLVFKGMDYEARVFVNDVFCGIHKGMYDAFCVDVTELLKEENKLVVIFSNVPQEMGQIGYTSRTFTQKSRFNYKWDFSTRLVNIGFWKDVALRVEEELRLEDIHLDTDYGNGVGSIFFSAELIDERLEKKADPVLRLTVSGAFDRRCEDVKRLAGMRKDSADRVSGWSESSLDLRQREELVIERRIHSAVISETVLISNPVLWHPNGNGCPMLYYVRAELMSGDEVIWKKEFHTGIRNLKLKKNDGAPQDALPYTFVVNDRKTWIKGVNMTPLDHLYGNVCKQQYESLITAMVQAGINLVRVWGGGLIEKEEFYELCDENGILVWQEFIQSSSGIDNKPSEDPQFLELLRIAATAAVKEKRNHVSLAVYSGGNELTEEENKPSGYDNANLAMLKSIVEQHDGRRFFLPTSASGPREFVTKQKGVSHDVHGNWRYEGNPGHYELYGESDNLFHSEFGMDAASSAKSLRKFLPEKSLHPTPMSGDANWQHHGEWWGTYFRDCEMFGDIERVPAELDKFVVYSQYMQSEGLRFILEADRKRAYRNSGTIIWQLNEPWPNASCTNLIDYYGELKSAYYQVKRVYEPCHISVDYRKLNWQTGETASLDIYVSNSGSAMNGIAEIIVRTIDGNLMHMQHILAGKDNNNSQIIQENQSRRIGTVSFIVPDEKVFFVTARLTENMDVISENTYMFSTCVLEPFAVLRTNDGNVIIEEKKIDSFENGRKQAEITLYNAGNRVVLEAGLELKSSSYTLLGNDNFVTLFPGEKRQLKFLLIPKVTGVFEEHERAEAESKMDFALRWI